MTWLETSREGPAAWIGEVVVGSRYTYGVAGERFFRALKDEGKILGTRCPDDDVVYVPARLYCEQCMRRLDEWVDVGLRGEVVTYTLLYVDPDGNAREQPELVAFVGLGDGGLVHRLGEVAPEEISVGMPVEAVLRPARERRGSIDDIAYFRPVGE
jgi:hypothetical protein